MQGNGTKIENCTKVWEDQIIIKRADQSIPKCDDYKRIFYLVDNKDDPVYKVFISLCISLTRSIAERILDKKILMNIVKPLTGHVVLKNASSPLL